MPYEEMLRSIIKNIGDNPDREGIIETPKRVVKSWEEIYSGYKQDVKDIFKSFEDEEYKYEGMVYLKQIEFYSTCEHHMLPFSGSAMVAYLPNGPVIGASKMARLVDMYARRLQMQERIAEQVVNALMHYLRPHGAACLIEAKHLCMACRGVKKQNSIMGYHALKGGFLTNPSSKQELMTVWGRK